MFTLQKEKKESPFERKRVLEEEKGQLKDQMETLLNKASEESRNLNKEERGKYKELEDLLTDYSENLEIIEKECQKRLKTASEKFASVGGGEASGFYKDSNDTELKSEMRFFKPDGSYVNVIDSKNKLSRNEKNNDVSFGQVVRSYLYGARNEAEERALNEGTDSAGGYTVPEKLAAEVIDRLRSRSTVVRSGMRTVILDSDNRKMAKLLTDPTVEWKAENAASTAADPTFGQVVWNPKTLRGLCIASNELIQDSLNIESAIEMAFERTISSEIDRAALLGSGSGAEPTGIVNYSNVLSYSMGTNGAALSNFDPFILAIQELYDNNANDPTAAIMSPRSWAALNTLKDSNNNYLMKPDAIKNLPFYQTSKIPVDDTQGTAEDASKIILGDFTNLVMGLRLNITIKALDQRYAENYQTGFMAAIRADFQPLHEESFVLIEGIIP